ncbi:MAG: hypothetical protein MHMPM18_003828 [Marteilia pararefringens]
MRYVEDGLLKRSRKQQILDMQLNNSVSASSGSCSNTYPSFHVKSVHKFLQKLYIRWSTMKCKLHDIDRLVAYSRDTTLREVILNDVLMNLNLCVEPDPTNSGFLMVLLVIMTFDEDSHIYQDVKERHLRAFAHLGVRVEAQIENLERKLRAEHGGKLNKKLVQAFFTISKFRSILKLIEQILESIMTFQEIGIFMHDQYEKLKNSVDKEQSSIASIIFGRKAHKLSMKGWVDKQSWVIESIKTRNSMGGTHDSTTVDSYLEAIIVHNQTSGESQKIDHCLID